ncbi:MAG TPA: class I SAM-dependent methyltransferase [Candidatus Lustribacter sp.]|jgi:SAM-dependent methyltransferase|nr:class I SAM-dependent methyltransferase [Candidatus Lustribacter sp.]
MTAAFWDERYRSSTSVWSGDPNPQLVTEVSGLGPGYALDVGSGEGADAMWLAERGWRVLAVDISTVALERSAALAAKAAPGVPARIEWKQADILTWSPEPGAFDLVSAQFMQLPAEDRDPFFRRLAAAVAPHGTLLVVGHHPSDLETTARRPRGAGVLYPPEAIASLLHAGQWEIVASEARPRSAVDPEGRTVTVHDTVVRALRR